MTPDLARLLQDPGQVAALSPAAARNLLAQVAGLYPLLLARALETLPGEAPGGDQLLSIPEVAARLGRSRDYVYRRAWPFEVKGPGRGRRFSAQGLDHYLRARQGR